MKQAIAYAQRAPFILLKAYFITASIKGLKFMHSDIAKYGLNSSGEPELKALVLSMIVKDLILYDDNTVLFRKDIYDFWRPDGFDYAQVDGKFSNEMYKKKFFLKNHLNYNTKQSILQILMHWYSTSIIQKWIKKFRTLVT